MRAHNASAQGSALRAPEPWGTVAPEAGPNPRRSKGSPATMHMGGIFTAGETVGETQIEALAAALRWGGAPAGERLALGPLCLVATGSVGAPGRDAVGLRLSLSGREWISATPPSTDGLRLGELQVRYEAGEASLEVLRAPLGAPALYYTERAEGFALATTPAALLDTGFAERLVQPDAATELLQLQFSTGRQTIFPGLYRLRPGERLRVQGGRIVERDRVDPCAWFEGAGCPAWDERGAFDRALEQAMGGQSSALQAPGMIFAGDAAATALLVLARRLGLQLGPIRIIDSSQSGQVSPRAKVLGARLDMLGLDHEPLTVSAREFWLTLPRAVALLDDPVADYGAVPLLLGIDALWPQTVAILSSAGAAEIFAGHGRFRKLTRPALLGGRQMRARGFLEGMGLLKTETGDWRDGIAAVKSAIDRGAASPLQAAQALDCVDFLHNDIINVHHRLLATRGLGLVAPMLAPEIARLGLALSDRAKIRQGRGQYILRDWLETAFPEARPFGPDLRLRLPVGRWLAEEGARLAPLLARSSGVAAFCEPEVVERLLRNLGPGKRRAVGAAWQLLFFALWHRIHIEGVRPEGDVFAMLETKS